MQTYNGLKAFDGVEVLEVVRVGNLARSPLADVGGVVDHRGVPLALVKGVGLEGTLPFTAARRLVTLGVADSGRNPVTVFLVVPLLRLLSICARWLGVFVGVIKSYGPGSGIVDGSSSNQPSGFSASSSGTS